LRGRTELVESLALREVAQRLACFLLAEARAKGYRTGSGSRFEMPLSKQQIAARVGTVREVVSRTLKRFELEGLIEIAGRRVTIPDEKPLEALLRDHP
jgi:CRP/FNR family transcriptional regulator